LISWIKVEKALFLIALKLYFKENNWLFNNNYTKVLF
jgi:hypothetical protein